MSSDPVDRHIVRRPRWAKRCTSLFLAALIACSPFLTISIPKIGPVGFVTPASAGFDDCVDAAKEAAELVVKSASLAGDDVFLKCTSKVTSADALSIMVDGFFTVMGAAGEFKNYDDCMEKVKDTVVGIIVGIIKGVVSEVPAAGEILDTAFQLVGSSLVEFMNFAGEELFNMLKTIFSPVFDYITCGCKIAGTIVELGHDAIVLTKSSKECAEAVAEAVADVGKAVLGGVEAVGEFIQCGLMGTCLVEGVQQWAEEYPPLAMCEAGWMLGSYEQMETWSWWSAPACPCGDGAVMKSKGSSPLTEYIKYHMSSKVTAYSYFACKCLDPKLGFQGNGECKKCLKNGEIKEDGTCPDCDSGEVSVNGLCKKCGDDEYIEGGVCKRWTITCPEGWDPDITPSTDPYSAGTQTCDKRHCPDGSIYDPVTKSCDKCKVDQKAVYWTPAATSSGMEKTTGTCEKCSGNLHSPPGSTMCCPAGKVSNGEECVIPPKKPGTIKSGATGAKLDLSNPKLRDEIKPKYNNQSIGVPKEGSTCPEGQVMTRAGCKPRKGTPRAPDLELTPQKLGSDPSRVPRAPPLQTYTPGVATPGGTPRTTPPPAPPLTTHTPGVATPGGGQRTAPPLQTFTPGVMAPGGMRTMPPPSGGKP